ncbi:MAG: hypothetical protein NWE95_04335 [Candidatus Bathyarchaeota archaeon]|nr:hypothetical protein [Candidatus Bathyarchaeota archaeon]
MGKRSFRHNNFGQVLVVTALLVALLLLSTALYVIETEKNTPVVQAEENQFSAYKQSIINTLISALANATNGGDSSVLSMDLAELKSVVTSHSHKTMLTMDYEVRTTSPYQNGIWISWGTNGQGVSSAYSTFLFNSSNPLATSSSAYAVNITSEINFSGTYMQLTGNSKQVNLTVKVLNEAKPALAQNFTFFYDYDGSLSTVDWIEVASPAINNFGNGTYAVSFVCDTAQENDDVFVSTYCHDQRGILVSANVTCVRIG